MKNLTLLPMLFVLAACMGHIRYTGAGVSPPPVAQRPEAYIVNPELKQERAVLEASRLYTISPDPGASHKITLAPLEKHPGCGNPMLGTILTLGLLPAHMPDSYTFGYTVEGPDGKQTFRHTVAVEYQYSLWELFFVFANDNKELGRALRAVTLGAEPDSGIRRAEVAAGGVH